MLGDNSSAYGINLDEQNHILSLMDNFISTMRVHGKKTYDIPKGNSDFKFIFKKPVQRS